MLLCYLPIGKVNGEAQILTRCKIHTGIVTSMHHTNDDGSNSQMKQMKTRDVKRTLSREMSETFSIAVFVTHSYSKVSLEVMVIPFKFMHNGHLSEKLKLYQQGTAITDLCLPGNLYDCWKADDISKARSYHIVPVVHTKHCVDNTNEAGMCCWLCNLKASGANLL